MNENMYYVVNEYIPDVEASFLHLKEYADSAGV